MGDVVGIGESVGVGEGKAGPNVEVNSIFI